jgi:Tub family
MNANSVLTGPDESAMALRNSNLDTSAVLLGNEHRGEKLSPEQQLNVSFPKEKTPSTPSRQQRQQPQQNESNGQAQELNQELIPFTRIGCSPTVPPVAPPTTNTTRHVVGSKARLLSPFAVPSNRFYGNRTRLVHGRVSVVVADKSFGDTKIYYDLQDKNDNGLRFPILMAVKKWKNRKYDIYDISWDSIDHVNGSSKPSAATGDQQDANNNNNNNSNIKVGTLEKMLSFHVGKISYKLCNASGAEESRISYRLHNPIMDKIVTPGRKCDLVLLTDEGKSKLITSKDIEDELKKQKAKDDGDSSNINNSKAASNNSDTEQPQQLLHHLFSKIPDTRNADQQFALDFKGRGRQASTKNAQLTDGAAQHGGQVVLQMSKVDDGIFHVDYRAPCTAFHAFAYALAQLDL